MPDRQSPRSRLAAATRRRIAALAPCPYSWVRAADDHDARLGRTRPRRARRSPAKHLAPPNELVGVRHRLDRVLGRLELALRDQDLLRGVVERGGMLLNRELELRLDPRRVQDRLDLLGLRQVARYRHLP